MPIYAYKCRYCTQSAEIFKPLSLIERKETCVCGAEMERQISAVRVVGDYSGYECPISGEWVEGRAAHRENLAKHGCRVLEPGEKEQAARVRAKADAELDASVESTAEQLVHSLPVEKRERLIAECQAGLDVQVVRQSV